MIDLKPVAQSLKKMKEIEAELGTALIERSEVIRAILLALLCRQHGVILGPPGTAKSMLITELAKRISANTNGKNAGATLGATGSTGLKTFVWLITKTTQPDELFGPVSIAGLKTDEFRRVSTGKLPEAELVFADEIFKGSSAILNTLLTIMNERYFDNGTQRMPVPLISLFAASNEMPQGEDLQALWDRLVIRVMVDYTSDSGFSRLIRIAAPPGQVTSISKNELEALQQTALQIPIPGGTLSAIEQMRKDLLGKGIKISDRRWLWSMNLLRAQALLEGRGAVEEDDLMVLKDALWSEPDQRGEIGRMAARMANPLNAKAVELSDQAASVHKTMEDAINSAANEKAKMDAAMEANIKVKDIHKKLGNLKEQAETQGRPTSRIEKSLGEVESMKMEIANLIIN
jgi:MoxR-like ATPase